MATAADTYHAANTAYASGRFVEAAAIYRQLLLIDPELADAHNNLANSLVQLNDFPAAVGSYRKAIAQRPDFVEAYHNLGALLQRMSRWAESAEAYARALELNSNLSVDVYNQLGIVLSRARQFEGAVAAFQRALAIRPDFPEALNNLGNVYHQMQQPSEAIACFRRAVVLRPDSAEIFNNLGNVLKEVGQLDHALAAHHRATELRPNYADAYNNLANTLKDTRRLDQALACYDAALAIDPSHTIAHSGKIYTLHFHTASTPQSLADAHRQWNARHAAALPRMSHRNNPDPNRRLRIGYVSPDFRDHVVGRFLKPLLRHHDRMRMEIFAYASVIRPDVETEQFKNLVDHWRNSAALSDEQLTKQIRTDEIDILIDLTMHMAGNRLLAFARKPAPIQVTYLAYCSTTGLDAMDYRFTDTHLEPPAVSDSCYSEQSMQLRSYWCYDAPPAAPEIAWHSGNLTFGCLNNFCKISNFAVGTWAKILTQIPDSRLILHAHAGTHRNELLAKFSTAGIASERIEFVGFMPFADYLAMYSRIDIALDPFPYAGGTTTCDALWMGVPVITLAGQTAVSRAGVSILLHIGLPDLVANSIEEYICKAIALAADKERLKSLRNELRNRMASSRLMDANAFARDVEQAYRQMWKNWCDKQ